MPLSAVQVNQLKHAPPVEGLLPAFLSRWSPRSFSPRAIDAEDLYRVFEAARWAASSSNGQPWQYLVGIREPSSPGHKLTYEKIFSTLVGFNQQWAGSAPVLILGLARTTFAHNGAANAYALYDLGAATSYLTLQASALGLASHQMAGYDHDLARQIFDLSADYALGSVIALGYQDEPSALKNAELMEREIAPRSRKPLKDFVFSSLGEPAAFLGRVGR
jgi:nitroreductase